ncbi:branched-chain amino acid transport system ATP-binding protein [Variovorax sp. PDC80]|jgi:branched-chain amino acid transport system ATP-binding protein|uniref:ABC transporter ATP-binding protein n=1 Tax=Variovorax TaxID=34072 RepID=UPI0008EFD919|nr:MULTISPECIES: ABC transporter ATP-binding protein [unclassified Variovorax]KAF1069054.1 MAG: High-affinity branched-chain amino acid transport ATP-binding protein LivF [Variovorax sp.]QRF57019.1 ABC transporter ATP-binding protein [Variovorax paradoxus]SFP06086.1 branched-chain amino acid transport system ATP-binding protein [Variovorax sp. PDC80]
MLKIESVKVSYGAIEAVKGVSLEVRAGEVVTIIGANGAGKSTLLKSIVGLEPVAQGRVLIDGKDCTQVPPHQRVGLGVALSPEGRGVFPDQTVRENLMLGAYSRRADKAFVDNAIEREFARFPRLKERQHQPAGTLSGGEQQMLAIARALMSDPRLLLLDEPSLGLAPLIIKDIFDAIRQLRSSGLTILLVEQMAKQALGVADRAYVLETGCITLEGSGRELLDNPKVKSAYLGTH